MATYGPHDLAIPEYPNSANGPDAFQRFAQSIEDGLYGIAFDEADRDTRYGDVPVGVLVSCPSRRTVWQKVGSGWAILAGERVVTNGASAASGFSLDSFEAAVDRETYVTLSLQLTRTGGTITAPNNGNIANTLCATLPTGTRPGRAACAPFRATATSGSVLLHPGGSVQLTDMNGTSVIETDQYVHIDATYRLGG